MHTLTLIDSNTGLIASAPWEPEAALLIFDAWGRKLERGQILILDTGTETLTVRR